MGRGRTADGGQRTNLGRMGLLAAAVLLFAATSGHEARAQCIVGGGPGPNPACPTNSATSNTHRAGQAALLDIGGQFLQRIAALSSFRTAASPGNNPMGGGADSPEQRYRAWLEGYGLRSRTNAQGDFAGDRRRAYGVVAGAGATIAPGVTVGLSVDQGRTDVNVAGSTQSGRIDLTQIGAIASFERGPWNLGTTLVRGFGNVQTTRADAGISTASYNARMWAAMAELSYFWALPNNSRIVPKLSFDWTRSHTDAFTELGGGLPVTASAVSATRVRTLIGSEIDHSWLLDRTIMDIAVYGRLVGNLLQDTGAIQVTDSGNVPQLVSGVRESAVGADAGATLSAKVTDMVRVYAVYDGRLRSNFTAHSGTVGAEIRF